MTKPAPVALPIETDSASAIAGLASAFDLVLIGPRQYYDMLGEKKPGRIFVVETAAHTSTAIFVEGADRDNIFKAVRNGLRSRFRRVLAAGDLPTFCAQVRCWPRGFAETFSRER